MTPELILRSFERQVPTDRISPDLRAYIRSEWRGDASWLRHEPLRIPLNKRFRRWLAARRPASPALVPTMDAPVATVPTDSVVPRELVEPCPHADAEDLGLSGSVVFLRCQLCGDVLVVDQGNEWTIQSDASESRESLLEVQGEAVALASRPR